MPIPERLGPYTILRRIGRGGAGEVYLARHEGLRREVALKILRDLQGSRLERFLREAQLSARLAHPNIVQVFDAGRIEGWDLICMQFIDGAPLGDSSLTPREAAAAIETVARAVHYAHEQGILHRDITPKNILVDRQGRPFLTDFGLAREIELQADPDGLSRTGMILGTPHFMAPEQVRGEVRSLDRRTDVWGLGATLYALLTGSPPFPEETLYALLHRITGEDPAPPSRHNPAVPKDLEAIVQKAMAKERDQRYATAAEMADELRRFLDGIPIETKLRARSKKKKPLLWATAIALVAGIALAGLFRDGASGGSPNPERAAEAELDGIWKDVKANWKRWHRAEPGGSPDRIEECLRRAEGWIERNPKRPHGYYVRACGRHVLWDLQGAREDLERAVSLAPDFAPGWARLGRVRLDLSIEAVWTDLRHAYEPDPALASLHAAASEALLNMERHGKGNASLRPWGLSVDPADEELENAVSQGLLAATLEKDRDKAARLLERADGAGAAPELRFYRAVVAYDHPESIEWYSRCLEAAPNYFPAYLGRAARRALTRRYREAVEDLQRATEILPRCDLPRRMRDALRILAGPGGH